MAAPNAFVSDSVPYCLSAGSGGFSMGCREDICGIE